MGKLLVETKDSKQVVGNGDEMHARHNRPSVVRQTKFMSTHVADGNLVMIAALNDEASDAEFAELWAAAKDDAAKEALKADYATSYGTEAKKKAPPEPKPKPAA